ncbi:hypothetical protein [Haliea sp. E17]|uniref:hypothetical protein n=1 Tax=Haliea sp. E17 TaxID=3401576 RepID=UPI003AB00157
MSDNNKEILAEASLLLGHGREYEAYKLLRVAKQGKIADESVENTIAFLEKKVSRNTIVAWRHDGLGERLITIIIGLHTAQVLGLKFLFVWPHEKAMYELFSISGRGTHSVAADPRDVLSGELVEGHLVSEEDLLHPEGNFYFDSPDYLNLVVNCFDKVKRKAVDPIPSWLASNRIFPDLEQAFSQSDFKRFYFEKLFTREIRQQLDAVSRLALPEKRVAVHIRGGDIVYGDTRLVATFGRLKSISLPVADEVCRRFTERGYTVLAFGATLHDLKALSEKYAAVLTVEDLPLEPCDLHTQVIREIALMGDCEYLISSKDTAVTKLAVLIGGTELLPLPGWISVEDEHRILRTARGSEEYECYHPLQKAFVNYSLYATAPADEVFETLFDFVMTAHKSDPDNPSYLVLVFFCAKVCGKVEIAESAKVQLEGRTGKEFHIFLRNARVENRFMRFDEAATIRLFRSVVNDAKYDADTRETAGQLLATYCVSSSRSFVGRVKSYLMRKMRRAKS